MVLCTGLAGCASIVSGGPKNVSINTTPAGAKVTIYDKAGTTVSVNQTPAMVSLSRSHGPYQGESYRIAIEKPGYRRVELHINSTVNGWYFGNILLGGFIGMVIVDPITGAMFTLSPDHIEQTLTPEQRSHLKKIGGLGILLKEHLTDEQRKHLKPMS
jgi:hypothetical protein